MDAARGPAPARSRRFAFWRWATFTTLLGGYVGYYLCRANLDAALPLIEADLGFTKVELGTIATISVWAYAAGKFTHGVTTSLIGGRAMFLVGMAGAALLCAVFGLQSGLVGMTVVWCVNRFVQAGGWIGMVQLVAQWFRHDRGGAVMAVLSVSFLVGDVAARALSGALVEAGLSWRAVFFVPAAIVGAMVVVALFTTRSGPESIGEAPVVQAGESPDKTSLDRVLVRRLFSQRAFWMFTVLSITLTGLRLAFLTWTASYFTDLGGAGSEGVSILKSAIFPATAIAGTLFAGFYSDIASQGRRGPVSVVLLAVAAVAMILMATPLGQTPTMAFVLVGICGFAVIGPYSLIAGAAAIDFGGREAAGAASAFLDGVGYLFGAVLGGVGMAALAQELGWTGAFAVLAGVAAASLVPALLITVWQRGGAEA